MTVQILETNGKPAFAVLPYAEYQALRELADDADDVAALLRFAKRYAKGEVETVPIEIKSNPYNRLYLQTKRDKMGHSLDSTL